VKWVKKEGDFYPKRPWDEMGKKGLEFGRKWETFFKGLTLFSR